MKDSRGWVLAPVPIQRWRCRLHGRISALPSFLHRYLHYLVEVVEAVLVGLSERGKRLEQLEDIDGPSPSTAYRWNEELLMEQVREWILLRLRGAWDFVAQEGSSTARASTIRAARYLAEQMRRKVFSPFLQLARLASMIRYAE